MIRYTHVCTKCFVEGVDKRARYTSMEIASRKTKKDGWKFIRPKTKYIDFESPSFLRTNETIIINKFSRGNK